MMDIPSSIIERLLIVNPAYGPAEARAALETLTLDEHEWKGHGRQLMYRFFVPQTELIVWRRVVLAGHDVTPHIARWLDGIGVTEALLENKPPISPSLSQS